MASSSSSSSHPYASLTNPEIKYDVFLSFGGEDTRESFTSHLYSALSRETIETFIDDDLRRGDEISQSLLDAIEASSISIIIFSESYASSRWCLDELLKILECRKEYAQIVIPVFYRVDPSHVRKQTGNFGDSFLKLEERFPDKMQSWRNALTEAADLSGFDSLVVSPESALIEEIVNAILKRLDDTFHSENEDLVGVRLPMKEIESLLRTGSTNVYKLGIWGIGGIGKTTIAGAIFNKISRHFAGSYFARNMEELVHDDALRLFSRHAFGGDHPHESHTELACKTIKYARGVPLALEVLGRYLYGKRREGTEAIQGISLDMSKVKDINLHPNTFTKMPNLRILKFYSSMNEENKCKMSYFQGPGFTEVRYLHWHGYPLKLLPSNIHPEKLVLLEMPHSNIEQLFDNVQDYGKLNQIITAAFNFFSKIPTPSLTQHLNNLVILNLSGCKNLQSLPARIHLKLLKELDLSGCSKLKRLPEISPGNITTMHLDGTALEELPSSIECLSKLSHLGLADCKSLKSLPSGLCKLKSLDVLIIDGCSNLQRLPEELGNLEALDILHAIGTSITEVPPSIVRLKRCFFHEIS
ncbi:hypothetical protein WN943_014283 [Citrus x changshan-huyou]